MISIPTAHLRLLVNQLVFSASQLGAGSPVSSVLRNLEQPVQYALTNEGFAPPLDPLNRLIERNALTALLEDSHEEVVSALGQAVEGLRPIAAASDRESARLLEYMHGRWEQLVRTESSALRRHPLVAGAPPVSSPDRPVRRQHHTLQTSIYRLILENSNQPLSIFEFDENDRPTLILHSQALERELGYDPEELKQAPTDQLFSPAVADQFLVKLGRARRTGELDWPSVHMARKNGAVHLMDIRATISRTRDRTYALVFYADTERRLQTEQYAIQAQRWDAIRCLISGLSHNMNNALMIPMGHLSYLELELRRGNLSPERVQDFVNDMTRDIRLIVEHIRYLRGGLGDTRGDVQPFDLHELLAERTLQAITKGQIPLEINLPMIPRRIMGPPADIQQVVLNLITNAVDAMEGRAARFLRISTDRKTVSEQELVRLNVRPNFPNAVPGIYVLLSVSDTGTGISPDVLPKIFDPYMSTKAPFSIVNQTGNSGLGLSTARHIVMNQGGFIAVETEENVGTTFHVYLPEAARRTSSTQMMAANTSLESRGNEVLLLVDDDDLVRRSLIRMLAIYKYGQILEANSGDQALKILERHPEITVMITDLKMPQMGGDELIARVRRSHSKLPIIAISGDYDATKDLGTDVAVLHKPLVDHVVLARLLRGLIDGEPPRPARKPR
ncbi:MAG TPA: ATP-binding protein [bacterium]|nr:ATP-binding protein [bacterium]